MAVYVLAFNKFRGVRAFRIFLKKVLTNATKSDKITKLSKTAYIVGVDCGEGPPVPIPNTEVKLACAENTRREAARKDK